jgi:ribonuclease D
MTVYLHKNDLPTGLSFGPVVAVDGEMMGLNPFRDRLCLMQLSAGDGDAHLVQFNGTDYSAPNLKALLTDPKVEKIYHVARTDIAFAHHWLGVRVNPVFCTKVASRLCRTFTDKHGMKEIIKDLLGIEIAKGLGSSDWGGAELTPEQMQYAAEDVLYLHALRDKLMVMLKREGRLELAQACFSFLPYRAELDLGGWSEEMLGH